MENRSHDLCTGDVFDVEDSCGAYPERTGVVLLLFSSAFQRAGKSKRAMHHILQILLRIGISLYLLPVAGGVFVILTDPGGDRNIRYGKSKP